MKIGIISDIHSNYYALESIIYEMNKYNFDIKICLGDMVGYYDKPNEVLDFLRENNFKCVKGNHDKYILGDLDYKDENEGIYGIHRHRTIISDENLVFLKKCKNFIEIKYNNLICCFCHSLKENSEFYINGEATISSINDIDKYNFYLYGHTHRKAITIYNKCVVINPGSVGQQRDKDYRPSFCALNLTDNYYEIISVDYDVKSYIKSLEENMYDERLINILKKY